jgi:hypothetical protein
MKLTKFRSTNIKLVMAAVVMGITFSLGFTKPAAAHNVSAQSFWVCGATRWDPGDYVFHSSPAYMHPSGAFVEFYCWSIDNGNVARAWHAYVWWNGAVTHSQHYWCNVSCPYPGPYGH